MFATVPCVQRTSAAEITLSPAQIRWLGVGLRAATGVDLLRPIRLYVVSGFSRTGRGPPEGGHYVCCGIRLPTSADMAIVESRTTAITSTDTPALMWTHSVASILVPVNTRTSARP